MQANPQPRLRPIKSPGWMRDALTTVLVSTAVPLLVATLLAAAAWVVPHFIPAPRRYDVQGKFTALPANDRELEEWLKEQPGIVAHSVGVYRTDARVVLVSFIIVRPEWGQPLLPDLEATCARLGYRGHVGKLKDGPLK